MPKIDVDSLREILAQNNLDARAIANVMEDIDMQLKAEEEERANRPPPVKKQFAVVLSDPDGNLRGQDITGWVVQIPEEESPLTTPERILTAAYNFNTTPKGRVRPIKTMGQACESVTAKFFKEQNVWIKTKTPVIAVSTPNNFPSAPDVDL